MHLPDLSSAITHAMGWHSWRSIRISNLVLLTFARHPFNSPLSELKIQELSFLIFKSQPIKIVMTIAAIEQKRLLHTDAAHCATPALRDTSDTLIRSNDQMLSSICMWQWAFPLVKMVWCGLLTPQLPPPSSPSTSWPHLLVSPDGLMWPSVASTTRLSITFAIIQQTYTFAGFRQTSKVHIFSLLFKGSKFRASINKFPRYFCNSLFFLYSNFSRSFFLNLLVLLTEFSFIQK